jgi:hypothetical protein
MAMSNGIIELTEGTESSESSESESSSSYFLSESSSSSSEFFNLNITNNLSAHWKMNDNDNSSLIRDYVNFKNMAYLYDGEIKSITINSSVNSGINKSIYFNGTGNYAKTIISDNCRFNNGTEIDDFSINLWLQVKSIREAIIISKKDVWDLSLTDSGEIKITYYDNDGEFIWTKTNYKIENSLSNIHVNCIGGAFSIYVNTDEKDTTSFDSGFSGENTITSEITIGGANNGQFFHGNLDNIYVINRPLIDEERYAISGANICACTFWASSPIKCDLITELSGS